MSFRICLCLWILSALTGHSTTANAQITIASAPDANCSIVPISITYSSIQAGTLYAYLYPASSTNYGSPKQIQTISAGTSQTVTISDSQTVGQYTIRLTNITTGHTTTTPITINAIPAPPTVVSALAYCQGASAAPLIATANAGGTLNWYGTSPAGGTPSSVPPNPQTSFAGTINYYVSQTVTGCESSRAAISVTVKPIPSSPLPNSATYCQGSSANSLTATKSPGGNLLWYTTQTGGIGSYSAITPQTNTPGIFIYYVSQTINGCESPRASANVVINPVPTVTITPADPILSHTQTSLTLTAVSSASALIWSTNETTTSILVSTAGPCSVTVTASNGCSAVASTNVILIAAGEIYSVKTGDWNDPTVWSSNQIPGNTDTVRIRHMISLPTNSQTQVGSLNYTSAGQLIMQNNSGLQIGF